MAADDMRRFMADHYYELDRAARTGEKKVAWCSSVGPAELLRAMGFLVYFPENHSAMLGTSRMATDFIPYANALGYKPEICSYLTADIGAFSQRVTPLSTAYEGIESIPKPDVLVFNTNQCRDIQDWFAWYAREFDAPMLGIYTHRGINDVTENHVSSIAKQLEDLVEPLEKISGTQFDLNELKQVVTLARECSDLWKEVLNTAVAVPSPLTFYDGATLMGPAVVGRGTQQAVDFYRVLLAELEDRIENRVGAVDDEQFRLYWEGMPIWGRLSAHAELFAEMKTCVLASTYCNSWIFSAFDPEVPFRSMAKAYTELFIVRSDEAKERYLKEMIDFFRVDGVIFHDARTCPNNSNCRYGMPQRLEVDTGVPTLIVDGDLNDLRCLSDEQTNTNIEAFIEQLEENK
ncbi:MAG: 2-hydroxyacyl-CoA dehydratase [Anaerolineales bacterium]|nr:2-hydroxyacyl-CoA dehydratase [Anaerolineales bacterium]